MTILHDPWPGSPEARRRKQGHRRIADLGRTVDVGSIVQLK